MGVTNPRQINQLLLLFIRYIYLIKSPEIPLFSIWEGTILVKLPRASPRGGVCVIAREIPCVCTREATHLTASWVCAKVAHRHMHPHAHGQLRWGLTNSSDCGHTVWASREATYPLSWSREIRTYDSQPWLVDESYADQDKLSAHTHARLLRTPSGWSLTKVKLSQQSRR